jgi:uncharacterized protein (DUF488 family)
LVALTLFTVGHSTRTLDELVELLRAAGVTQVVDVRRFPGSWRHPQFGAASLAAGLGEAGIAYRHEPALGGRRKPRPDSVNTAWRNDQVRGYADHMASAEFAAGLAALRAAAAEQPTAVLCAEAWWRQCHRQLLADAMEAAGWEVIHLLAGGAQERHPRHPQLRVEADGVLTYPAAEPAAAAQRSLPGVGPERPSRASRRS